MSGVGTRASRPAWTIVARREIVAQLTDKAFWIGTLTTLGIVVATFLVSALVSTDATPTRVAIASDEAAAVIAGASAAGVRVEALRVPPERLEEAVSSGDAAAALSRTADGWVLSVDSPTEVPDLGPAVRAYQIGHNATEAGVDPAAILAGSDLTVAFVGGDQSTALAITVASFAFAVLFMLSAVTYGMQIAQSVVTEKESRIVEILAAAVTIRSLLIGKVVGNTLMALSQVVLLVAVSLTGMGLTHYRPMLSLIAPVAGWFILFFLVGFASLACLWAAAGAMATRVQDLTQTTTPLTMLVMLAYVAGFVAKGGAAQALSYLPIVSTVLMPGRLLSGESTWVDALAALLVSVVFMALAVRLGAAIYRRGLLQTNAVVTLRQLWRRDP